VRSLPSRARAGHPALGKGLSVQRISEKLIRAARVLAFPMSTPTSLLERIVDQRVSLRLKDSRELAGRLLGLDDHMNLVLDEVEETTTEGSRRLGRVLVRGSNVISLTSSAGLPPKRN
jgi:small nuclear ribonucleoprotein